MYFPTWRPSAISDFKIFGFSDHNEFPYNLLQRTKLQQNRIISLKYGRYKHIQDGGRPTH